MSLAVRGMGCNKQGVAVMGHYRTYDVTVTYTGKVEVFVPLGEDADDIIDSRIGEIIDEFPSDVEGLSYSDDTYREV